MCYLVLLPYAALEMVNAVCDKAAGQTCTEPNLVRVSQTANERKVFCTLKEEAGSSPKRGVIKFSNFT